MPGLSDIYQLRRAGDYTSPRNEGALLPLVWGRMDLGGVGGLWEAPCIDTANYVYAVAGCALLSVADGNSVQVFDKDGVEISSGWTFNEADNYESQGTIATLTFTADQQDKEPITVRCQGRGDGSGSLISNPVEIARDFLLNLAGWSSERINSGEFARVAAACESQGYVAGWIIDRDRQIGQSLSELLTKSFFINYRTDESGRIVPVIEIGPLAADEALIAGVIRAQDTEHARVKVNRAYLCNQAAVEFAYNWHTGEYQGKDDGASGANAKSQGIYGEQIKTFQAPAVRTAAVAAALGSVIVSAFAFPVYQVELSDPTMRHALLEPRDRVLVSSNWIKGRDGMAWKNQIGKMLSVQVDPNRQGCRLALIDTGYFLTTAYLADGTYTAGGSVKAGGDRDLTDY